jgi:hypothetical protein
LLCSPDAPFSAELAGHGFVTAWYDPELKLARELADADSSGAGWRALFARTGARYAHHYGSAIGRIDRCAQ